MLGYSIVGAVGASTTFIVAFFMRRLAPRIGAVSMPGSRSVHTEPMPSLGGAAMFAGFLVAMAVASQPNQFREMFADFLGAAGAAARRRRHVPDRDAR